MQITHDIKTGVVIIGSDFQALGAIRSLAEKNIPVFLLEYELGISRFSRYVNRRTNHFSLEPEKFSDQLVEIAKKENLKGWMLFPNDDKVVKLISMARERLKEWYQIPVPQWETVQKFYFKDNANKIADELSIPIPKVYQSENLDELLKMDLNFPLVLKPTFKEEYYPITKKKGIRVDNRQELIKEYGEMASIIDHKSIIIQDMILGGTKNLYSFVSFFDGKKVVAGLSAQRLRQHPMDFGHATTYAEAVVVPELKEMAEKLLKAIGYYGISEVEFMRDDRDGKFKFLEINGRVWGWHTLAKAAGLNLPYMLHQHMNGLETTTTDTVEGAKWIRLITDIPTSLIEMLSKRMKIKDFLKTLRGVKEFSVLSRKDPLPFIMEFLLVPYLWWKRGF